MRILSPLLLATAMFAAEQPAPLLTATLPDVQRSIARFNDSIYGTLWNDPQMASTREKLVTSMDAHAEELGFKISELLLGSRNVGVHLRGFTAGADVEPQAEFTLDLGPLAEKVFAAWQKSSAKKNSEPLQVPGADAAFSFAGKNEFVIARFGHVLAGATQDLTPTVWAPEVDDADAVMAFDSRKLLAALIAASPERKRDELRASTAMMDAYLGATTYRSQITKQGMLERYTSANACPWMVPVDRAVLDRLPATAMNALAVGLDGKKLWEVLKKPLLVAAAKERGISEEDALAYLDKNLANSGMTITFTELIEGLTGTFALAIAPGAPFPTLTLSIPRTPALDAVVTTALGFAQSAPPAEGGSTIIPVPNMPVTVTLARDEGAWMITSDALFPTAWLAKTGGFLASPAAKLASERGGAEAVVFGCSDTPMVLRNLIPYLAMGLGQVPDLEPDQRQAILQLLQTAATKAGTGYVVAMPQNGGIAVEMRGLLTYSLVPVIAGAITIPNLLESRVSSNEAAAAANLKSSVFPAEVQFQGGMYVDDNGNGIGDFGFFSEMSGGAVGDSKIVVSLMPETWNAPTPLINGYRFAVFLPDDREGSVDSPDARRTVKAKGEEGFIAYAWPDEEGNGRKMFAITATGTVYASDWDGQPPAWNALWGAGTTTWKDEPAWKPYRR